MTEMRSNIGKILFILFVVIADVSYADGLVIVSVSNPAERLSLQEIQRIYLKKQTQFKDGTVAEPINREETSDIAKQFYEKVIGKNNLEARAYWMRLLFTRGIKPPMIVKSDQEVLEIVKNNRSAIGFVSEGVELESVRVVYSF